MPNTMQHAESFTTSFIFKGFSTLRKNILNLHNYISTDFLKYLISHVLT